MTDPLIVPVDGKTIDWPRRVSNAFKSAAAQLRDALSQLTTQGADIATLQTASTAQAADITAIQSTLATRLQHPFEELASAPASPTEGRTYYDTALHKTRTWDGTAWQDHW